MPPSSAAAAHHASSARIERKARSVDWLLIVIPGVIWGASFVFIAEGLKSVAPNGVTFVRILVGFLTLGMFPAARKPIERPAWMGVATLAILLFAFPLSMFPFAEQRLSSAVTGMLNAATPLFASVVAFAIARRMPSSRILLGLLTGVAGSVLVAVPLARDERSSTIRALLILIACASYGLALNVARPLQQKYGALPVIWRALGIATLLTAPFGLPSVVKAHWSAGPLLSLLALGAAGTGIAFVLTATATGNLGTTRASATTFLTPPVALLLGLFVRGEHIAFLSIIGSAISLCGVWMIRPQTSLGPPSPEGWGRWRSKTKAWESS